MTEKLILVVDPHDNYSEEAAAVLILLTLADVEVEIYQRRPAFTPPKLDASMVKPYKPLVMEERGVIPPGYKSKHQFKGRR